MNKEVVTIGGAVLGGMVSNGVGTLLPQSDSPIMNVVIAGASAFGAIKVSGSSTKDNVLRGALMGSAVVQALIAVKKISSKSLDSKLSGTGKPTQFMRGAVGLGCPDENGLHGALMGADGNVYEYDEGGLHGTFMDEHGNVFEQAADGLHGVEEDIYGLQGVEEEIYGLQGAEEELYGLQGEYDEEY
jgi:hypothetical protein